MTILYVNLRGVIGDTGRAIRSCGHKLELRSGCVEALQAIRDRIFDALVIEDGRYPEILDFTVEAHKSCPGLPIFVANTWAHGLLAALEDFVHVNKDGGGDDAEFSAVGQADSVLLERSWDEDLSSVAFSAQENAR